MGRAALVIAMTLVLAACGKPAPAPLIFDGHNDVIGVYLDTPPRFSFVGRDISKGLTGQSDGPRLRQGGYGGALITLSGGVAPGAPGGYFPAMREAFDWYDALVLTHSGTFARALTPDDARAAMKAGRIALTPAIEGAGQFDGKMENLVEAHRRGVRSVMLVYDHNDDVGDGAMAFVGSAFAAAPAHGGLTPFGRELVGMLNDLGVIVDLSHAAEITAMEALKLARAPVIFSHSGARGLADTPRNVSDATLAALKENGGLIMIPFVPYLTTTQYWRWYDDGERAYAKLSEEHRTDRYALERAMAAWEKANPQPVVTVAHVADQVEYAAARVGRDHVGIGSDFGGMGRFVVTGLEDAAATPALFAELRRRGWSDAELAGLASDNFLRTWAAVAKAAR
jgi:membrane dipeptidase